VGGRKEVKDIKEVDEVKRGKSAWRAKNAELSPTKHREIKNEGRAKAYPE